MTEFRLTKVGEFSPYVLAKEQYSGVDVIQNSKRDWFDIHLESFKKILKRARGNYIFDHTGTCCLPLDYLKTIVREFELNKLQGRKPKFVSNNVHLLNLMEITGTMDKLGPVFKSLEEALES